MFVRFTHWFGLSSLALVSVLLTSACSSGEESVTQPEVGQLIQRQDEGVGECECTTPKGETVHTKCYDTCFPNALAERCGDPRELCATVCKFGEMEADPGKECEAVLSGTEYRGLCARSGVTPADRAGCCAGCITREYQCGGPADPRACGLAGATCTVCEDKDTTDCKVPVCAEGKCTGIEVNVPTGTMCSLDGTAGRCTAIGTCCTGCLSPAGVCFKGTGAGACGLSGVQCVNCDNAKACDGQEVCDTGECQPGQPLVCNDNNDCTMDSCDDVEGCTFDVQAGSECNDGDGCTVDDTCNDDGGCSGSPKVCSDGNDCTTDSCDNGACSFTPVADTPVTNCDDGSSCTLEEDTVCVAGVCTNIGAGTVCHDEANPCVTSSCGDDGTGSCMEVNRPNGIACDDGDACTSDDSCQEGVCLGGGSTDCDDNNACTTDSCEPASGCAYEDATGECADGNLCTTNDRCVDGACAGDPIVCPEGNDCQAAGSCDTESGLCSLLVQPDGTDCGEGGECVDGDCDGEMIPMVDASTNDTTTTTGSGGSAGAGTTDGSAGAPGAAGDTGDDGAGGTGGSSGGSSGGGEASGGAGGTFTGRAFARDPQGCDCRAAPGSSSPAPFGLGLMGLGAVVSLGARRRRRARS